jgi:hypothetical protein
MTLRQAGMADAAISDYFALPAVLFGFLRRLSALVESDDG